MEKIECRPDDGRPPPGRREPPAEGEFFEGAKGGGLCERN